jgi:hypothetical protein
MHPDLDSRPVPTADESAAELEQLVADLRASEVPSPEAVATSPPNTAAASFAAVITEPEAITEPAEGLADFAPVLRAVRGKKSAAELRQALLPPGWDVLLRRAAVPRAFDQTLFDRILAAHLPGQQRPAYEEFIDIPEVEKLPPGGGQTPGAPSGRLCRVRWVDRNAYLRQWWDPAKQTFNDEFLELTRRLAE